MGMKDWWNRVIGRKASAINQASNAVFGFFRAASVEYTPFVRNAFSTNVVAYRAAYAVADAVASVPYLVMSGDQELEAGNQIVNLLARPSPDLSWQEFTIELKLHRILRGNAYVLATKSESTGRVTQLQVLHPDNVTIKTNDGVVVGYEYRRRGDSAFYPVDERLGVSRVLHLKEPTLEDKHEGQGRLAATALSLAQHNQSIEWNAKLLTNGARVDAFISLQDANEGGATLNREELQALADDFNTKYSGAANAGRIPFLTSAAKLEKMSLSPNDMAWRDGKDSAARDIALAIGYPPFLLGMAEGSTFQTVQPS